MKCTRLGRNTLLLEKRGNSLWPKIPEGFIRITYDPEADVLRILFSNAPIEESDEEKPGMILDYERMVSYLFIPGRTGLAI